MDIQLKGRSDKYGFRSQQYIGMVKNTKVCVIAQGEYSEKKSENKTKEKNKHME